MRKKCIAIAKKAMVWTLAASMLVATPLTASAAGLRDVYKVEDGWGNTIEQDGDDDTSTGTVSSTKTDSNTSVLKGASRIEGIVLSETDVKMEMEGAYNPSSKVEKKLTVDIVWSEGTNPEDEDVVALEADLIRLFKWSSDKKVVALDNRKGKAEATKGIVDEMFLVAKAGGDTKVTVSLNDNENNIHLSATANVSVKQFASELAFSDELAVDAYEGVSLNLDEYLVKTPKTATDEITYEITDTKNATLKNGVLKFKTKKAGEKVTVVAIGERAKPARKTITIREATPATKVEIRKVGTTEKIKSYPWVINTDGDKNNSNEFEVVLTAKVDGTTTSDITADNNRQACTDQITWSSKKPSIVEVKGTGKGDKVKLIPKAVGKAQIIAQASGGKKATLNVDVKANLTGFEITANTKVLYSGQSIKLGSVQHFAENGSDNFTDAGLKWSFAGSNAEVKAMKKVASINAKTGVLTIKPDITNVKDGTKTIKVTAANAKAIGKKGDTGYKKTGEVKASNSLDFDLKQVEFTKIVVFKNMSKKSGQIAAAHVDGNQKVVVDEKNGKDTIAVPKSKTYAVYAEASVDGKPLSKEEAIKALNWGSSSEKVAVASRNANGSGTVEAVKKGTATISVSGPVKNKSGKYVAMKTSFKASVTVPTKTLVLTTKNSAIAGTGKNQNIAIKATLEKGTTSKAKDIKWSAVRIYKDADGVEHKDTITEQTGSKNNSVKGGKLVLKSGQYAVGDTFVVTARLVEAGVQTSMTLKVVKASGAVQFVENAESDRKLPSLSMKSSDDKTYEIFSKIRGSQKSDPWLTPDVDDVAKVTYTVSKKGIVQLVGNKVTPIKKGNVKITATTADGKKATLTVKVTD